MVIKQIAETYIESYRVALDNVAKEGVYIAFLEAPSIEIVRDFIISNNSKGNIHLIVIESEEVIGWCSIHKAELPVLSHSGFLGMGLIKQYRGKGIGNLLLKEAILKAKSIGLKRIELDVFATNTPAINLYLKYGFSVEGRKVGAAYINEQYTDVVVMGKLLQSPLR